MALNIAIIKIPLSIEKSSIAMITNNLEAIKYKR